jgi:hypothetical protein
VLAGWLYFIDDAGREIRLTWPLSVAVAIARHADEKPDWSARPDPDHACVWWTTSELGAFNVHLDLDRIDRVPGETRAFQVGVCLPDLEPGGTWRRTQRVLPQTVRAMPIDGPPVLDENLAAINACVANDWRQYEPVAYVRVVNRLRRLGKQRALETLRRYVAIVPSNGFKLGQTKEANADYGNSACVFGIVRLLFDFDRAAFVAVSSKVSRAKGLDRALAVNGFAMSAGMVAAWPDEAESYPGSQYPFVVVGDLPFFAPEWRSGRSGYDANPLAAIEWAAQHGTIRATDLRPTDDPIRLAETLRGRVGPLPKGTDLAGQVWRALAALVGAASQVQYPEGWDALGNPLHSRGFGPEGGEFDLTPLKQAIAAHGGVHWDEPAQRYALGPGEH